MAKTFLTPEELVRGNHWLKHVFFPAAQNGNADYIKYYDKAVIVDNCKKILDALINNIWDVNGTLDGAIATLASAEYYEDLTAEVKETYKLKEADICSILANMCQKCTIFWDDSTHTKQELDYFMRTKLGRALWNFRCFTTQSPDTVKVSGINGGSGSTASGQTGSGHTLYLSNAGGLTTKQKVLFNSKYAYWVCGEWTSGPAKTKPRIHVSPQDQPSPLKVKFNSGQGYNDCILFFEDPNQADAFKVACESVMPTNTVTNLSVKKVQTDPNGYFEVETNCGKAFIKAIKLHEDLEECGMVYKSEEDYNKEMAEAWNALNAFMR